MAFVPGHKHDLFLSYSHDEAEWVTAFAKALCKEFLRSAGKPVSLWQDTKKLELGRKWDDEIPAAVREAAAFLAIVSPRYHSSPWCREEQQVLLKHYGGSLSGLKVESFYRLLKIIKAPGPGKAHETLAKGVQHVAFYREADESEHDTDSREFAATIRDSVRAIRELLQIMANKQQALYVAPGPMEMGADREALQNHLSDFGYNVKPAVLLSPFHGDDPVREEMEPAVAAVFLLGCDHDKFIADQMKIAQQLGKRMLFWIHPTASEGADKDQQAVLERVRQSREFPQGSQVLGGASIQSMIVQLKGLLQKEQPTETEAPPKGQARVYLIYDSTLTGDAEAAGRVGEMLLARHVEVLRKEHDEDHKKWMRLCSGALLFRSAPSKDDWWLTYHLEDLQYSREKFQRAPDMDAKAALVADASRISPGGGVDVLPYSEPLSPAALDPFFEKLGKARRADASR